MDPCIYIKVSRSKFIILILYVIDILLASRSCDLLVEIKSVLSKWFDMKDLRKASFILGIEIGRDRLCRPLGLSQRDYVDRVLGKFGMGDYKPFNTPIAKGDKLSKDQCPKNDLERSAMKDVPYASVVGSLMYAQVCTRPNLSFVVSILGRFLSNPVHVHWLATKRIMR